VGRAESDGNAAAFAWGWGNGAEFEAKLNGCTPPNTGWADTGKGMPVAATGTAAAKRGRVDELVDAELAEAEDDAEEAGRPTPNEDAVGTCPLSALPPGWGTRAPPPAMLVSVCPTPAAPGRKGGGVLV